MALSSLHERPLAFILLTSLFIFAACAPSDAPLMEDGEARSSLTLPDTATQADLSALHPSFDKGYDHLPRGFFDVNADGRVDFCRFVGNTGRIFLSCALAGATSFEYQYAFNSAEGFDVGYAHLPRGFVDINADGRADYCRFVGNTGSIFLSCALAETTGFGYQYAFNSVTNFDTGYNDRPRGFTDVNGDGRADYCRFVGNTGSIFLSCALAETTGFGYQYAFNSVANFDIGYGDKPRGFTDVNGDGRADYCRFVGNTGSIFLSCALAEATGFGYQYAFSSATNFDIGYNDRPRGFTDVNGDGRADYCRFVGNTGSIFLSCALSSTSGFGYQYAFNSAMGFDVGYGDRPRGFTDVNGDGRADYCRFVGNTGSIFLSCALSDPSGSGFGYQYAFNSAMGFDVGYSDRPRGFTDVTGDGRSDYCRFVGNAPDYPSCALSENAGFGYQYQFSAWL
jgi:hypothetical protein